MNIAGNKPYKVLVQLKKSSPPEALSQLSLKKLQNMKKSMMAADRNSSSAVQTNQDLVAFCNRNMV